MRTQSPSRAVFVVAAGQCVRRPTRVNAVRCKTPCVRCLFTSPKTSFVITVYTSLPLLDCGVVVIVHFVLICTRACVILRGRAMDAARFITLWGTGWKGSHTDNDVRGCCFRLYLQPRSPFIDRFIAVYLDIWIERYQRIFNLVAVCYRRRLPLCRCVIQC